jgi:hypothetical protein
MGNDVIIDDHLTLQEFVHLKLVLPFKKHEFGQASTGIICIQNYRKVQSAILDLFLAEHVACRIADRKHDFH